jgi:hypothetical protein
LEDKLPPKESVIDERVLSHYPIHQNWRTSKLPPKKSVIDKRVGTSEETKQILKPPSNPTELEDKAAATKGSCITIPPTIA